MRLALLRTKYGFTREQLAARLGVTEHAFARWETGKRPVPQKHLRDLAIFFGVGVGALRSGPPSAGKARQEADPFGDDTPYGTLALTFVVKSPDSRDLEGKSDEFTPGATHYYSISEGERSRLLARLDARGESPADGWLSFTTLDNRYVFVNPAALESIQMVGDDVVEMPVYEHEETYKAIAAVLDSPCGADPAQGDAEDSPYSRQLIESCDKLIAEWGGEEVAEKRMNYLAAERLDGERLWFLIEDEVTSQVARTLTEGATNPQFVDLYSEGYYRATFFRLGALRLMEVPLTRYRQALDGEESGVSQSPVSAKRPRERVTGEAR